MISAIQRNLESAANHRLQSNVAITGVESKASFRFGAGRMPVLCVRALRCVRRFRRNSSFVHMVYCLRCDKAFVARFCFLHLCSLFHDCPAALKLPHMYRAEIREAIHSEYLPHPHAHTVSGRSLIKSARNESHAPKAFFFITVVSSRFLAIFFCCNCCSCVSL